MLDKFEELCPGKLKNKDFKIIEPCCGKGAFLIELYKRRGSL
jgi:23S rRNA G2445 N2-methylase RlmL